MSTTTTNLGLVKPDPLNDAYDVNVTNGNMDKIDAFIKVLNDGKLGKTEKASDSDFWRGWKIYNDIANLNLSGSPTIEQIIEAMSDLSRYEGAIGANSNFPANYGQLTIVRLSQFAIFCRYIQNANSGIYFVWEGAYISSASPKFTGWKEIYHSGNYGVLKSVSGNYILTNNDHGKIIRLLSGTGSNASITVPPGLRTDFECTFINPISGSFALVVTPANGITIYSNPDNTKRTLNGNSAMAYLKAYNASEFHLAGNLKV